MYRIGLKGYNKLLDKRPELFEGPRMAVDFGGCIAYLPEKFYVYLSLFSEIDEDLWAWLTNEYKEK